MNFDDNTDINAVYLQLRKQYPKIEIIKNDKSLHEQTEDEYLLALALERMKNDTGVWHSHEEVMAEFNITQEEIDETEADFD